MPEELNKNTNATAIIHQNLSALVRARLLFKKEVEIDRGSGSNIFSDSYLQRLVETKNKIDESMIKVLMSSATLTLLLYLVGEGTDPELPIWGLKFSKLPGIIVFLAIASAYSLAMAAYTFMNSQSYAALIDQIILEKSNDGIYDVDMIKSGYEVEWLIFKVLRNNFSFYAPVHIRMGLLGRFVNNVTFAIMVLIAMSPFIVLLVAQPYISFSLLHNDWVGVGAKIFTAICSISVVLTVVVANFGFECEVDTKT